MQRFLDIFFSLIALFIISPLFLAVMLILKFTGEGKIFFRQPRIGQNGKIINIIKFATMLENSPKLGAGTITLKDDPRVLPVGKILRKTKINELPQLLNIVFGDMSIIGPRPQTRRCFSSFPLKSQQAIASVRPGLSGLGSIYFRDEEEMLHSSKDADAFYDEVIMPFKGELEEWYVAQRSLKLYFVIIFLTLSVLLLGKFNYKIGILRSMPKPPGSLQKFF